MIYVNLFFNVSINFNIILFLFNDNLLKWIQMTLIIWGWILRNTFKFNTWDLIGRRVTVQINFYFYKKQLHFAWLYLIKGCCEWRCLYVGKGNKVIYSISVQMLILPMGSLNYEHFNSLIECTFVNSLYDINCHSYFLYTGIRIGTYSEILRSYKIHRSYKLLWGSQF